MHVIPVRIAYSILTRKLMCVHTAYSAALAFMYSSKEGAEEMDLRGSSLTDVSGSRVSAIPPDPSLGAESPAGSGAASAETSPFFAFMYSSKEGAAEMDLRGSSLTDVSGSRVSAIPPDPSLGSSKRAGSGAASAETSPFFAFMYSSKEGA